MGGDGGVVAVNRRYMRGAGSADHTGDYAKEGGHHEHNGLEAMTTCHLTKLPLFSNGSNGSSGSIGSTSSGPIVACVFGRLYQKEAAVEALLTRASSNGGGASLTSTTSVLGDHVRKMSDLHEVRFHQDTAATSSNTKKKGIVNLTCPITGKALLGIIPAILLVPGKAGTPNVLSESAFDHLPKEELELEYGPIKQKIRLAPPPELLKQLQEEELENRLQKKSKQQQKKNKKKRKQDGEGGGEQKSKPKKQAKANIGTAAKSRVDSAIESNQVLSSLFTTTNPSKKTDKERKDGLFAR
ncbi:unnamed protein product [Cylindrotheca closterium]|uniref:Replication termination factor 2 n=1 Tax=Cylindrotheca closterium TaxID=2856 RepID=A0AAD2FKE4_9STRA|nr:unnamed protein product [Cylindrotheca closterium]